MINERQFRRAIVCRHKIGAPLFCVNDAATHFRWKAPGIEFVTIFVVGIGVANNFLSVPGRCFTVFVGRFQSKPTIERGRTSCFMQEKRNEKSARRSNGRRFELSMLSSLDFEKPKSRIRRVRLENQAKHRNHYF